MSLNLNPQQLERLLERNLRLGTDPKLLLQVFEGFLGLLRVRAGQREMLDRFEWRIAAPIVSAKTQIEKGEDAANWFRQALEACMEPLRYLIHYSEKHTWELWEILKMGLTTRLPVVDAIASLEDA